jgi:ferric-dicitrate binding protein FerR (iron transport regulator)
MTFKNMQRLIAKYLNKQASQSERDNLELWLENPTNYERFKDYVKTNHAINLAMDLYDADDSKKQLLDLIKKEKKVYKLSKHYRIIKYAAVLLLFIGLGHLYQNGYFTAPQKVNIPPDSITLQLENGNIEIINENGTTQVLDAEGSVIGSQKGNQLVYNDDSKVEALEYNTLTVPFGKRFEVKLSDGTKVFLNAGTSLRYPTKCILGEKRQVFLTGEAFFDVASDTSHAFIVNAKNLNVEVLGTEFNMSAYPEDSNTDVVLVEGAVGMYANNKTLAEGIKIKPGIKGTFNRIHKKITTEAVDVSIYTSWMEGSLVFRNMPFKNIVKKLERRYNMKIVIENKKLDEEIFNATFKDEPPIQEILNSFGKSYGIKHTIKNNAIFIN